MIEQVRMRGKWSVSPLREAKTLLGVLKQRGLAGKGLIEAFEKWAPRIVGSSRADMNRLYREQSGREMSDYILAQQADKAVRYNQLPPEAEVFRQILLNSRNSDGSESDAGRPTVSRRVPVEKKSELPTLYKVRVEVRADRSNHDGAVLLTARNGSEAAERASLEVADFFGIPATAVSVVSTEHHQGLLLIDGLVVEKEWSRLAAGDA
jgi:hypothetical protein